MTLASKVIPGARTEHAAFTPARSPSCFEGDATAITYNVEGYIKAEATLRNDATAASSWEAVKRLVEAPWFAERSAQSVVAVSTCAVSALDYQTHTSHLYTVRPHITPSHRTSILRRLTNAQRRRATSSFTSSLGRARPTRRHWRRGTQVSRKGLACKVRLWIAQWNSCGVCEGIGQGAESAE